MSGMVVVESFAPSSMASSTLRAMLSPMDFLSYLSVVNEGFSHAEMSRPSKPATAISSGTLRSSTGSH